MSNPNSPESPMRAESGESFGSILSQFERSHAAKAADGLREGTVVSVSSDSVFIDLGLKTEGVLSFSEFQNDAAVKPGDKLQVTIKGRDPGGYYLLTRSKAARPTDWAALERRYSELKEGETVSGTVRSLTDYGAFVDVGGVDALLHVSDISWSHVNKPADVLSVGQEIEARVLKIDPEKRRISIGMKQLQPHPWDSVLSKYKVGDRVRGTVTRVTDFGAFVELEPGVEGLIHVSEMSWVKKVRKPSDLVKPG